MAYFTGRLFGKHKLAPTVSPKKTIEGSIGGSLFCAAAFVLMGVIVGALVEGSSPNYIYLAISGLVISVISQIGDLIFSVLKRQYNVKDFSNLFPGHGGMIDRMDSVFSVALGIQAFIMLAHLTGISFF
jgi:phosphatidate cytidylyltransferase